MPYVRLFNFLKVFVLSLVTFAAYARDARAQQSDCCGCLCADAQWSCSADTCTDARAAVVKLAPEAGFLELEPGFVGATSQSRGRMFYAFRPADEAPETKPLLIFFQGGPAGSMLPLWGGNVGPVTFDPDRTSGAPSAANPNTWTRFANLLWVDSPYAGFSYITHGDNRQTDDRFMWNEAAAYTSVLMRFLSHHPQLAQNRVVLVGESYGGSRAAFMLSQVLQYKQLAGQARRFDGNKLAREIEAHVAITQGPAPAGGFSAAQVGARFGQVLIQPSLGPFRMARMSAGARTAYNSANRRFDAMAIALLRPQNFDILAGVKSSSIRWMYATERLANQAQQRPAQSLSGGAPPDESAFAAVFGSMSGQKYFRLYVPVGSQREWNNLDQQWSLALHNVPSFMTNAGYDHVVDTDAILADLDTLPGVTAVDRRPVDARNEDYELTFSDGSKRALRSPAYPTSGHTVTLFAPSEFAADVQRWLGGLAR